MLKLLVHLIVAAVMTLVTSCSAEAATSFRAEVSGHGRPMIFIPGVASSGDTWKGTAAHYRDRFTCHVLTLAGFAGVPPVPGPLMATARDEIAAYIREQHLDKPIVVGHSLGGTLTLDLAIHEPGLVGPIVIVDALPFMIGAGGQVKTLAEAKPIIDQMTAMMKAQTPEQTAQFFRGPNAPGRFMVTAPEDAETISRWGVASDATAVGNAMAELFGMDLRDDLSKIQSPALVLGTWIGLRDQMKAYGQTLTRDQVVGRFDEQFAKLPQRHFEMSDTARHFIMLDDPQWFFARVDAFLADAR